MIKRDDIDRIPTHIRDSIKTYLETCINKSKTAKTEFAEVYVNSCDEKARANSLIAQGEHDAFLVMYNIFK